MTTAVHVNTSTYATTHVATNLLGSIRSIIKGSGLNPRTCSATSGPPSNTASPPGCPPGT